MSYSKVINPKKKRRVFDSRGPPFPVPISSITGEPSSARQWMYYTGNLVGNQVIVHHTGDINYLYKMGFFGKGTLSRSKPEFNQRCKMATLPTSEGENIACRIISRRSYIRRLNWSNGNKEDQIEEFDSSQELSEEDTNCIDVTVHGAENSCTLSSHKREGHNDTDMKVEELNGPEISQSTMDNDWTAAVDSWDNAEADEDFWGVSATDRSQPSASNLGTISNMELGKHESDVWESSEGNENFWGKESKDVVTGPSKQTDSQTESPQGPDGSKHTTVDHINSLPNVDKHDSTIISQVEQQCSHKTTSDSCETKKSDLPNEKPHVSEMEDIDPLSLCEEEQGNLFVIEDSDNESRKRKRRWKSVIKEDPYFVKEFLHLSLEESFFLAYGLGCLRIYENEKLLSLTELWRAFSKRHDRFISLYVAYHYFRSKGWVPKSGLKFGADFIIYKEGPPFYHGSYSVIVKMVREQDFQEEKSRTLTWTQLAGLNRLTEHVAKQLLICYVIKPEDITPELLTSPKVISKFKVKEIVVSRWVSSQERELKTSEEIP